MQLMLVQITWDWRAHTCLPSLTHTHTHTHTHIHTHTHTCAHTHTRSHTHTHAHTHLLLCLLYQELCRPLASNASTNCREAHTHVHTCSSASSARNSARPLAARRPNQDARCAFHFWGRAPAVHAYCQGALSKQLCVCVCVCVCVCALCVCAFCVCACICVLVCVLHYRKRLFETSTSNGNQHLHSVMRSAKTQLKPALALTAVLHIKFTIKTRTGTDKRKSTIKISIGTDSHAPHRFTIKSRIGTDMISAITQSKPAILYIHCDNWSQSSHRQPCLMLNTHTQTHTHAHTQTHSHPHT